MITALVTDVFDGIIARKLGVSSEKLRLWDSNVDVFFWLITISSIFYLNSEFVKGEWLPIVSLFLLELFAYIIAHIRFKKAIATHSILAKVWTVTLLFFLIDLTLHAQSHLFFWMCVVVGVLSRIEIILMMIFLKKWTSDVPSIFSVFKLNKGIDIKKNKLFNS